MDQQTELEELKKQLLRELGQQQGQNPPKNQNQQPNQYRPKQGYPQANQQRYAKKKFLDHDWSMVGLKIAGWLIVVTLFLLVWTINGWYSVDGLKRLFFMFNNGGVIAWGVISSLQVKIFQIPVPVAPWSFVLGTTLFQVLSVYRRLRGMHIPKWALTTVLLLSAYDLITTYVGLGGVHWVIGIGWIFQLGLALFLAFSLESFLGWLLGS